MSVPDCPCGWRLQNPNLPDSNSDTTQYYALVLEAYESQIAGSPKETPAMKYFWQNYFKPVWQLYIGHPDGPLKGAELGPVGFPFEKGQTLPIPVSAAG